MTDQEKIIVTIPFYYFSFTKPDSKSLIYENIEHVRWELVNNNLNVNNLTFIKTYIIELKAKYANENVDIILNDSRLDESNKFVINIIGFDISLVNEIKAKLLQNYNRIVKKDDFLFINKVRDNYLFSETGHLKKEFTSSLDNICKYCKISISIQQKDLNNFGINFISFYTASIMAENRIRLAIDSLNPILYVDYIDLKSVSILPLIGGIKFNNFKQIVKQTNCHLYLPNVLSTVSVNNDISENEVETKIFITGLKSQVFLTKHLLSKLIKNFTNVDNTKTTNLFIKNCLANTTKKDLIILLNHEDEPLQQIIYNNGCFIQLSSLGSESKDETIIHFQASNSEAIENSINEVMALFGNYYNVICNLDSVDPGYINNFISEILFKTNNIITLNGKQLKICGPRSDIKRSVSTLNSLQFSNNSAFSNIKYQIELDNEERDFIGGKKNGKMLKIMNNSKVALKILAYTEHNFIIELHASTLNDSIIGLKLLEDELPTTLTFNVPESFHRQIIGVGGSTVQTIMRKYNVFIKFSNTFVYENSNTTNAEQMFSPVQSFIRKDNVIIKCPSKNGCNVPYAQLELKKLVENCSNSNYYSTFIKLSRSSWRLLSNNSIGINNETLKLNENTSNSNFINDLEKRTNTLINYSQFEPSNSIELLEIKGIDKNSVECSKIFEKDYMPLNYEFKLSFNKDFYKIYLFDKNGKASLQKFGIDQKNVGYKFLNQIIVPFKIMYNIEVQAFYDPKLENDEEDLFNNNKSKENDLENTTRTSLLTISNNVKNYCSELRFDDFNNNNNGTAVNPQFHSIILTFFKESEKHIKDCIEIMTNFLRENNFMIIDKAMVENKSYIVNGSCFKHLQNNKENFCFQQQPSQPEPIQPPRLQPTFTANHQQLLQSQQEVTNQDLTYSYNNNERIPLRSNDTNLQYAINNKLPILNNHQFFSNNNNNKTNTHNTALPKF
ncbi:hypothetical protein PACTADRAFT_3366 [Pachysolen tannophilus NRRL Y-2460]|uniref:K Homology domain-containing protein n=1 Tax=Pachysolen tannophilus NRRL Y-2460 TaxID=669874 RepID=A0A1E4TVB9_PACTA|nr:hypothetical protein PACTADRAFT_3366 [Pachysolen tannophilus NRRL Y-2460]